MRISDWSSDVCSSDLGGRAPFRLDRRHRRFDRRTGQPDEGAETGADEGRRGRVDPRRRRLSPERRRVDRDRKSVVEGKSVSVRVDLGGRRIIKTKKNTQHIVTTISRTDTQKPK